MNLFHLVWLVALIISFILSFWIKHMVIWGTTLALVILMAYRAITDGWEVYYFPFIVGFFILALLGFIHDGLEGRF